VVSVGKLQRWLDSGRTSRASVLIRLAIIAGITAIALSADSVETFTSNGSGPGNPFDFYFSDFNPSLGTLDSMTFSVTGGESVLFEIDNCNGGIL
jgi:hypothetical protein